MVKGQQDKQWQTIQWLKDNRQTMTDNTMAKGQSGQTMTDNTMVKGQQDKQWQTIQWLKDNRTNNDTQYNG